MSMMKLHLRLDIGEKPLAAVFIVNDKPIVIVGDTNE
jgi:hypothetical protein